MSILHNKRIMRFKTILIFIGLSLLALVAAFGLLSIFSDDQGNLSFLEQNKVQFTLFRLFLIAALVGFWPKLVDYFSNKNQWDEEKISQMTRLRWRVAVLFILVELIVIQEIFTKLF